MDTAALNVSPETKSMAFVSTAVGCIIGAVAAWDKPGSSMVAVAGQVALMTMAPIYLMPKHTPIQVAATNGALMAAVCYGFHSFGVDSCTKYALLVGAVTFASLTLLAPQKTPPAHA